MGSDLRPGDSGINLGQPAGQVLHGLAERAHVGLTPLLISAWGHPHGDGKGAEREQEVGAPLIADLQA